MFITPRTFPNLTFFPTTQNWNPCCDEYRTYNIITRPLPTSTSISTTLITIMIIIIMIIIIHPFYTSLLYIHSIHPFFTSILYIHASPLFSYPPTTWNASPHRQVVAICLPSWMVSRRLGGDFALDIPHFPTWDGAKTLGTNGIVTYTYHI